jgi:hypothetical protein
VRSCCSCLGAGAVRSISDSSQHEACLSYETCNRGSLLVKHLVLTNTLAVVYLFMIYLTTLSVLQNISRRTVRLLVNDEIEMMWKEALFA